MAKFIPSSYSNSNICDLTVVLSRGILHAILFRQQLFSVCYALETRCDAFVARCEVLEVEVTFYN